MIRSATHSLFCLLATSMLIFGSVNVWSSSEFSPITVNETRFDHLVTQNAALEYYPEGSDSAVWNERLIVGRSTVAKPALSAAVDSVKADMGKEGVRVIRDYPVTTASGSTEHFLVAVANGENYLEMTARRFMPLENAVVELIYARREYGSGVGPTLSRWMQENGEQLEAQLLSLVLDDVNAYIAEQ